jgi:hypothetical protein
MNKMTTHLYFKPLPVFGLLYVVMMLYVPIFFLIRDFTDYKVFIFLFFVIPITLWFSFIELRILFFLFKKIPVLILNETQLIDNFNNRKIYWIDILDIRDGDLKSRYLSIALKDPAIYINKMKNGFIKKLYRLNTKLFKATFTIHFDILKGNKEENLKQITTYWHNASLLQNLKN